MHTTFVYIVGRGDNSCEKRQIANARAYIRSQTSDPRNGEGDTRTSASCNAAGARTGDPNPSLKGDDGWRNPLSEQLRYEPEHSQEEEEVACAVCEAAAGIVNCGCCEGGDAKRVCGAFCLLHHTEGRYELERPDEESEQFELLCKMEEKPLARRDTIWTIQPSLPLVCFAKSDASW